MAKVKSKWVCQQCGYETAGYLGKCPECGAGVVETEKAFGCSAWKKGCKFDSWDDHFDFEKWMEAFDESGLDEAYEWVCQCFENDKDYWAHAKKTPLQMAREMGIIE